MENQSTITLDMIIEKFVPILGAVLFSTGLGYLIYTTVWESLIPAVRLGVGFFVSFGIIGGAFFFSERLRYFADVIMGAGVLLLYGTLIYGSRTSDDVVAIIPEIVTIFVAFFFTVAVVYLSTLRRSKVILALALIGAYGTPFVIGQADVWSLGLSFNSYLIYFAAVNALIFWMGRDIAIHDLIPLNLFGMFFGTYTLYQLVYENSSVVGSFFSSENFSIVLLGILVMMSVGSIAYSSRFFSSKAEVWVSLGYLAPLFWFLLSIDGFRSVSILLEVCIFILIGSVYFGAWYSVRSLQTTHYQHIAAYVGGILSGVFALNSVFPDFDIYASLVTAYIGLIFAILYVIDGTKGERVIAAFLFTLFGGILSLGHATDIESDWGEVFMQILGLTPAILLAPLIRTQTHTPTNVQKFMNLYSIFAGVFALLILLIQFVQNLDFFFLFFVLPGFLLILVAYLQSTTQITRPTLMRVGVVLMSLGVFSTFFFLLSNIFPHVADDEHFWKNGGIFANWHMIKAEFAVVGYFLALSISRQTAREQKVDRPSFLLVIAGYTFLLLMVNYMIITLCNDLGVSLTTGGVRAVLTTLWWIALSLVMISVGIRSGVMYRSEKLFGLLLLLLTVFKIGVYDLEALDTTKKVVVLMVVGGGILLFSYVLQVKGYLKSSNQ